MNDFLGALWFFLPAGLANAAPVAAAKIPFLKQFTAPMDFGKSYRGKRVFGANKTWRGLCAGVVLGLLIIALQRVLTANSQWLQDIAWIDYSATSVWLLGPLFALGALIADAVESFFKRQRGVQPGERWFPFDQIDYIIGGCLLSLLVVRLSVLSYVWVLFVWFGMHIVSVYIFYRLGIRDKPI